MLRFRTRWYKLFDSKTELEELFVLKNTASIRTMFGEFLLVKKAHEFYCFDNICPHQRKQMNDCSISEDSVICPYHKFHFSLKDGKGHGLCLEKHQLKINDEGVFVGKEKLRLF